MRFKCRCKKFVDYEFDPKNAVIHYRYTPEKNQSWVERWFMDNVIDVGNPGYFYNFSCSNCGLRFEKTIWKDGREEYNKALKELK